MMILITLYIPSFFCAFFNFTNYYLSFLYTFTQLARKFKKVQAKEVVKLKLINFTEFCVCVDILMCSIISESKILIFMENILQMKFREIDLLDFTSLYLDCTFIHFLARRAILLPILCL